MDRCWIEMSSDEKLDHLRERDLVFVCEAVWFTWGMASRCLGWVIQYEVDYTLYISGIYCQLGDYKLPIPPFTRTWKHPLMKMFVSNRNLLFQVYFHGCRHGSLAEPLCDIVVWHEGKDYTWYISGKQPANWMIIYYLHLPIPPFTRTWKSRLSRTRPLVAPGCRLLRVKLPSRVVEFVGGLTKQQNRWWMLREDFLMATKVLTAGKLK